MLLRHREPVISDLIQILATTIHIVGYMETAVRLHLILEPQPITLHLHFWLEQQQHQTPLAIGNCTFRTIHQAIINQCRLMPLTKQTQQQHI